MIAIVDLQPVDRMIDGMATAAGIKGVAGVAAGAAAVICGPKFHTRISPSSEPETRRSSDSCKLVTAVGEICQIVYDSRYPGHTTHLPDGQPAFAHTVQIHGPIF